MGRFLPPDHDAGDESTVGGYAAVHGRPAALEGMDGHAYSLDILTDRTGDPAEPWGAFLVFLRWSRVGEPAVEGHLESEWLAWGGTPDEARALLGDLPLADAQRLLDHLIVDARDGVVPTRRWMDARAEDA